MYLGDSSTIKHLSNTSNSNISSPAKHKKKDAHMRVLGVYKPKEIYFVSKYSSIP